MHNQLYASKESSELSPRDDDEINECRFDYSWYKILQSRFSPSDFVQTRKHKQVNENQGPFQGPVSWFGQRLD